jgi:hypothetical protein
MTATTERRRSRSRWFSILIALAIVVAACAVFAIAGGMYLLHRYAATSFVPAQRAQTEFEDARARVSNGQPLVEIQGHELVVRRTPDQPMRQLSAAHVLAYDPAAQKLLNVTVPGWLLRFAGNGRARLNIDGTDVIDGLEGITLEDLQRHGPGLVLDTTDPGGRRVLVWTE